MLRRLHLWWLRLGLLDVSPHDRLSKPHRWGLNPPIFFPRWRRGTRHLWEKEGTKCKGDAMSDEECGHRAWTRDQRNALVVAVDSEIRSIWPELRGAQWPDARLVDAIARAVDREEGDPSA